MTADYTYMVSNNKISEIMDAMTKAAKPDRLTHQKLKEWGFSSSNDRAIIPLFKRLGILDPNGAPTELYDDVKDPTTRAVALASILREAYSELFSINTEIYESSDAEIKAALSRVTGKDEKSVDRYFATFNRLVGLADFKSSKLDVEPNFSDDEGLPAQTDAEPQMRMVQAPVNIPKGNQFHYNIQIHLPATSDITVYNAIFKSLKENLDVE